MPTISFHYPQFLALLLLLPLVWRYLTAGKRHPSAWLRLALALAAILALARPRIGTTGPETDLIVIVDRSASCADASDRMLKELLPLVRGEEKPGDRTAVLAFGSGAIMERGFAGDTADVLPADDFEFGSDLAGALRLAGAARSPDRRTAVLCLSDGLYTGANPLSSDVLSDLGKTPFWYRRLGGGGGPDVAAGGIATPEEVEPRSAWVVRYSILASTPVETEYVLSRNGLVVARGKAQLRRGENHFFIRDTVDDQVVLEYRLETATAGDSVPENNSSRAVLKVRGAPRALVVAHGAEDGLVSRALRAAAIPVDLVDPRDFPAEASLLEPYRLVVLENCRVSDFPGRGVAALAEAVKAGVCSLLVTGGNNAFGMGGYHRSPLDPLLPVEMELRTDVRRGSLAVAMALDRSGSMAVPTGDGRTKMDLANLGAAESIRLLAGRDQVAVIAVDSTAHIVVPLSVADDPTGLAKMTLGIKAMGGGIYCLTALQAAAAEIRKSSLVNRHIIIFADANDAEEQEGCLDYVRELVAEKIAVSVVAMGTERDSDAGFLMDLAAAGGGEALFSYDADGLPALFTQEIMRISRRGFLDEPVTPRFLAAMRLLGLGELPPPPRLLGYNVSGLREGATAYMNLDDEWGTPLLATRFGGRASTGAILFEVDGEYSGEFARWPKAPELVAALARRLAGGVHSAGVKSYSSIDKGVAEAVFEFSPEMAAVVRSAPSTVRWLGPGGLTLTSNLEWLEPERARSRISLAVPGHYLPFADLGAPGTAAAPPVSVSYSSEFDLRDASLGWSTLTELAALTGGGDGLDIRQIRESGEVARPGGVELRPYLLVAIILLFLLELSGRRILWFS